MASVVILAVQSSYATPPCYDPNVCVSPIGGMTAGQGHYVENRAYVGFEWAFDKKNSIAPEVVFGLRSLTVKSDNAVSGGDFSLRFNAAHGWNLDSAKLVYIGGNRDVQGNIGGGYSFVDAHPIVTAAIQVPYALLGDDYVFGLREFRPFAQINTLQKVKPVQAGSNVPLSCPSGYSLANASSNGANASQTKNGQTCIEPL